MRGLRELFVNTHELELCIVKVYIPAVAVVPLPAVVPPLDDSCKNNRCIIVVLLLITIQILILVF